MRCNSWQESVQKRFPKIILFSFVFCLIINLNQSIWGADIEGTLVVPNQHTVQLKVKDFPIKAGCVWRVKPIDGQDPNEIEWITAKNGAFLRFIGPAGRYDVSCTIGTITQDGGLELDIADCVVTIGPPSPGPKPPVPPDPPVPPSPTVTLLQSAYQLNSESDKLSSKSNFASLYRQGADFTKNNSSVKTYKDLFDAMKSVSINLKISGKINNVQQAIHSVILADGIPMVSTDPISVADRAKIISTFLKIADSLDQVK